MTPLTLTPSLLLQPERLHALSHMVSRGAVCGALLSHGSTAQRPTPEGSEPRRDVLEAICCRCSLESQVSPLFLCQGQVPPDALNLVLGAER
jgi:hypothetical protein